ncbi:hypothetical protein K8O68_06355 [Salipaludibacillus sp. CUR1]|uniref:hypothetical protein n=1 Tax=Salipaludibacillus sp. CUR1 TaxID=2820003 RepID=UPI001E30E0D6|nr:hypothetical protein [Salipaludibacillus sp. CUR1]MCE7792043.1 hypothetical protein [Salipaludibacillus sp. CUR1]
MSDDKKFKREDAPAINEDLNRTDMADIKKAPKKDHKDQINSEELRYNHADDVYE